MMIRVGIVGATGYTGQELIHILLGHPEVKITYLSRSNKADTSVISDILPLFKNRLNLICGPTDIKTIISKCDLVFLALPHTASMDIVPRLILAGKKVIDLSADYRIKNTKLYRDFYHKEHRDRSNLKQAVYGLPELYRNKIKGAQLIANPGCYPTVAILSLAPLVAMNLIDFNSIVIDAKSGVSGAGKKNEESFIFSEANEDFRAYKVNVHQHIPEINQILSRLAVKKIKVTFVPHLLPINRGILATVYAKKSSLKKGKTADPVLLYKRFYNNEPFIRIKEGEMLPRIKDVAGTNYCDIAVREFKENIIVIAVIDNLMKGAAGQAVQNMNIAYKLPEQSGLL